MFYINYEECKLHNDQKSSVIPSCFILTMRNVNLGALKIKKLSEIGFILTMRNVNTNGFFFAAITFIVLY